MLATIYLRFGQEAVVVDLASLCPRGARTAGQRPKSLHHANALLR